MAIINDSELAYPPDAICIPVSLSLKCEQLDPPRISVNGIIDQFTRSRSPHDDIGYRASRASRRSDETGFGRRSVVVLFQPQFLPVSKSINYRSEAAEALVDHSVDRALSIPAGSSAFASARPTIWEYSTRDAVGRQTCHDNAARAWGVESRRQHAEVQQDHRATVTAAERLDRFLPLVRRRSRGDTIQLGLTAARRSSAARIAQEMIDGQKAITSVVNAERPRAPATRPQVAPLFVAANGVEIGARVSPYPPEDARTSVARRADADRTLAPPGSPA